jgi:pimeloyl-ACP methyl ester carboxylesterase
VTDAGRQLQLAVDEHGPPNAPTVVLVHGAFDRSRAFRRVVDELGDLRVVSYDRRGYGRSLDAVPATSLDDHCRDLLHVIGERDVTVVAHSFGAHVAVLAALAAPARITSVGLWEPPVPWMEVWPDEARANVAVIARSDDPERIGEGVYRRMVGEEAWERLDEPTRALRRAEGVAFTTDMASELDAPYRWEDLTVPCIIGYGGRTWPYSHRAARHVAGILGCPTFTIDEATHVAHVTEPTRFAEFVRRAVALGA